ncbi:cell division control protein 25 [Ceratobasidium sp. AG-Ba]|nr:cell division control protein 25 [Ceratobasidium sp. AG-Ba]
MSGNLSRSMRENYDTHGVDEYYKIVGTSYRNPHFPGIKQSVNIVMNKWWQNEAKRMSEDSDAGILICDLAAGSGEVTAALQEWWETCRTRVVPPVHTTSNASQLPAITPSRPAFVPTGRPAVSRPTVSRPMPTTKSGPSLHAPSPLISATNPAPRIVAVDPYTADAYLQRTGLPCIALSFQDVAQDGLPPPPENPLARPELSESNSAPRPEQDGTNSMPLADGPVSEPQLAPEPDANTRELYNLVICSFALHLVTSPGALFALLSTLSYGAQWLVVLEPHKKPEIKEGWGWILWDVTSWKEAEAGPGKDVDFVKESV